MRVLVADDHPLVRRGLIELLRMQHPDWGFAEAGSYEEVLDCCSEERIDLASIDLLMPGLEQPAALAQLRRLHPELKVVILTGADSRSCMLECLTIGVHGYVLKSSASDHLLRAIEIILEGGIYFPSALAASARAPVVPLVRQAGPGQAAEPVSLAAERPAPPAGLTGRQRDVLDLLAQGCSTKDIARRLNLGIGTVKVHLAGVYKTLGARNRMEAVVKAGWAIKAPEREVA